MSTVGDNFVNSMALTMKATESVRRLSGGQILGKETTSGGAAFPVNTQATANSPLAPNEAGKGQNVNIAA